MSDSRVLDNNSLLASLSLLLPFTLAPGVSNSRIRDARCLALYILSYLGVMLTADMSEMHGCGLKRV